MSKGCADFLEFQLECRSAPRISEQGKRDLLEVLESSLWDWDNGSVVKMQAT